MRKTDCKQDWVNDISYCLMLYMCDDIIKENNLRCTPEFLASIDTLEMRMKWHEFVRQN